MRKKLLLLALLLLLNAMILPGCWNYREIDKLSIVAGMAVDKDSEGRYLVTVEIVDLHEGGMEPKIRSKILELHGDTIFDAVRNSIEITAPKLYWGHTEIVILSRQVAKEGIVEIIDWLDRDAEPRLSVDVLVSRGETARELLSARSISTDIRSFEINKMLEAQANLSKAPSVEAYMFIDMLASGGISPVLPSVSLTDNAGQQTSQVAGTAVFKGDRLVGFLDGDETKYFLFATGKIKGGLLTAKENPQVGHKNITLEVFANKTTVRPVISGGKLSMSIKAEAKVSLDEHGTKENFMDKNGIKMLEDAAEQQLSDNIRKVVKRVQKDFDADIFGFGRTVKGEMPSLWRAVENEWDDIFRNMEVSVESHIEIDNTGLLSKPIKVGD